MKEDTISVSEVNYRLNGMKYSTMGKCCRLRKATVCQDREGDPVEWHDDLRSAIEC